MSQSHRILGLLSLVLFVSAPVTWLVSRDLLWVWTKLLLGLGLGAVWALAAFRQERSRLRGRSAVHALVTVQALLAALVLGGLLIAWLQGRALSVDMTSDQVYTLAPQSQELLQNLAPDPSITAFFSPKSREARILKKLVEQLRGHRPDLRLQLVDPQRRPDLVKERVILADGPRIIVEAGGKETRLRQASEQTIAQAFKRLSGDPRPIYFTAGHDEPQLLGEDGKGFARLARELKGDGVDLRYLNILEAGKIPADARAVVLLRPTKPLLAEEKRLLNHYLSFGGRILLFLEPDSSLKVGSIFEGWGLSLGSGIIVDPSLAGRGQIVALGSRYGEHPVVKALAARRLHTVFPSAAPVIIEGERGSTMGQVAALVGTSNKAWVESEPGGGSWRPDEDEARAPLLAAMAFKDSSNVDAKRSDEARLVLVGDSDFLSNSGLNEGGNRDFVLNLFAAMADDEAPLELHAASRLISRILLTDREQRRLQLLVLDLIPLFFLLPGLVIWIRRRGYR